MIEKGPRDRAVSIGSKEALVQTRRESAKQLTFTNGPFGRTTKQVMTEIAEGFTKKLRPVGECFYDVEGLAKVKTLVSLSRNFCRTPWPVRSFDNRMVYALPD